MWTVTYDEDRKVILVKHHKPNMYQAVWLRGGTYETRKSTGRYPLNEENLEILDRYKRRDDIAVKPALMQAIVDFYKDKTKRGANQAFLKTITIDSVKKYPYILKNINGNPPPFHNQHISQYWQQRSNHHALLWEMGTGKTRAAIEGYRIKKSQGLVDKGLVVCPVSMLDKWVEQIETWGDNKAAIALKGTREQKLSTLKDDWDWYCITFESLASMIDEILEIVNDRWFVILDEFTKIKNPKANRSRACIKLGRITKYKAVLSGTPITQHAYDIFTPYLFLDNGKTFGVNYDEFLETYYWAQGYKKVAKTGTLDKISNKIYDSATRFLKKECIDIPDKVYDTRLLDLPPYNREKYNEMVKWCITQIEGSTKVTAAVILTQLLRLSQITSGFVVDTLGKNVPFDENPKIDALSEILDESNESKIIVWCRFIHDVDAVSALCDKVGVKYVTLHGETKPDDRTRNVAQFQNDKETRVIVGTAGTGGHGIDLTAATIVVYYSNSYSLEQRLQSEDRAHRAGQVNKVTYIDLLCRDTIDLSIYKILRNKKSVADIVTKDNLRSIF